MCGLSAPREGSLEAVMRGDQALTAVGAFQGNLLCKLLFKEVVLIWFPCELHKFFALNLHGFHPFCSGGCSVTEKLAIEE